MIIRALTFNTATWEKEGNYVMKAMWIKYLFLVAALYDGILGIIAVFWHDSIFELFSITPANHPGYIQFPALLLLIFAVMFFRIYSDPVRFHELIPYGMGLKVAYCLVVFWHTLAGNIPSLWLPWAWLDLLFLVLFIIAWRKLQSELVT